jgi:ribonuclease R
MTAERNTVDRMMAQYLSGRVGATFDARVSGVTRAGLFVALVETGADGFVPISTLRGDYYIYDETRHALIGRSTGETYQLGDAVEVRLMETAPIAGGMRFEMVSPGKKGKRPTGAGGRGMKGRGGKKGKNRRGKSGKRS